MSSKKLFSPLNIVLCGLFTALIAVGAFIKIPVPVIPFTMQTMFVTMAGLFLGSKLGGLSALLYMVIGLMGIPVFTQGGGPAYIFQPTFGYIVGFVVGAFLTGFVLEKLGGKSVKAYVLAVLAGIAAIYLIGCVYLYFIKNIYLGTEMSVWNVLLYGFLVTLPGDLVFSFVSAFAVRKLKPIIRKTTA